MKSQKKRAKVTYTVTEIEAMIEDIRLQFQACREDLINSRLKCIEQRLNSLERRVDGFEKEFHGFREESRLMLGPRVLTLEQKIATLN